jgi:hypothetical protein
MNARSFIPPFGRSTGDPFLDRHLKVIAEVVNGWRRSEEGASVSGIPDFAFFNDSGGATRRGYLYGQGASAVALAVSGSSPVQPAWIAAESAASGVWCPFSLPGKAAKVRAESISLAFTRGAPVWVSGSVPGTVTPTDPASGTVYVVGQAGASSIDSDGFIWVVPRLPAEVRFYL